MHLTDELLEEAERRFAERRSGPIREDPEESLKVVCRELRILDQESRTRVHEWMISRKVDEVEVNGRLPSPEEEEEAILRDVRRSRRNTPPSTPIVVPETIIDKHALEHVNEEHEEDRL